MTAHAREALADCETLLADVRQQQLWGPLFRLRWAGLVALLRAVGHVAELVDGKASPEARQVIRKAWKVRDRSNPAARIFWEFVWAERNNILKAYRFGAGVNRTVYVGSGRPSTDNAFMRSGSFAGRDPLELCDEAIAFWRAYLDEVDLELGGKG